MHKLAARIKEKTNCTYQVNAHPYSEMWTFIHHTIEIPQWPRLFQKNSRLLTTQVSSNWRTSSQHGPNPQGCPLPPRVAAPIFPVAPYPTFSLI